MTGYGEEKENSLIRKDGDLWIEIWEELHNLAAGDILVEVQQVKAHRKKKEKKDMSHFEKFVTEGNEKADELAKEGAMLDEGFMAGARAKTVQQEREEVYAALQCAARFHCLIEQQKDCEELKPKPKEKWIFVDKKSEETKHRTEWCAEANKYRCMRCGKSSKHMKMPGKCAVPKILSKKNGAKRHLGGHGLVRRVDRQGEAFVWCRKCSGCAQQRMGPQLMNCCKPEQVCTKEHDKMFKRTQVLEDGRVPAKEARAWKIDGQKKRIARKGNRRLLNDFEMGGFMAQKRSVESRERNVLQDRGALPKEEGDVSGEIMAMHEENS